MWKVGYKTIKYCGKRLNTNWLNSKVKDNFFNWKNTFFFPDLSNNDKKIFQKQTSIPLFSCHVLMVYFEKIQRTRITCQKVMPNSINGMETRMSLFAHSRNMWYCSHSCSTCASQCLESKLLWRVLPWEKNNPPSRN